MKIEVIYLAAGFGSRFGSNKLLYDLDGRALYRHGLDMLLEAMLESTLIQGITVVTQYPEISQQIRELRKQYGKQLCCMLNPHSERGISSSLQIGLLSERACQADAYLFCVADEPYLKKETLLKMLLAYEKNSAYIMCMNALGHRSNPVIFDKRYRQELFALRGDVGGRQIFAAHAAEIEDFFIEDESELKDIDYSRES